MKLIFNDEEYAKDILSFLDADFQVKELTAELYTASREVYNLIGQETYSHIQGLSVKEEEKSEDEAFLLFNAKYAILLDAWRHHAPSRDLSHTLNGRKMRNDTNEKSAFEWMVNNDNENLERKYYHSLDTLLNLLDETNPVVKTAEGENPDIKWKNTEAYKSTYNVFVRTTKDFEAYFPIHSRYLLEKLQPGMSKCQRTEIKSRLGAERYNALLELAKDASEDADNDLIELIKEATVYYAMAWAIRRLRVTLLPEGILQKYKGERVNSKNSKPPEKMEAELAAQSFDQDTKKALLAIEDYLKPKLTETEAAAVIVSEPNYSFDDDDSFVST
ncbi:hypothetical protein J0871_17000 [Salegentibacter sp. BDJ18]|uniref:DUF6712 family protein n=1 Tax=Salegentibacter sp. BDJ18 TaxID=2816376 RepID=UPI001AAF97EB|nr:DUF6712 family protein [Salegentibacter sp. BDJ18]MBO2546117.1 hypothetical protein [Salegentibacter sp. BDJ18]